MADITDVDEAQWARVRAWLANDPEGRRVLGAFADNPAAGSVALRRLLRNRPAINNQISDAQIEKFVNLAHADQINLGDQTINYMTLDVDPIVNSGGFPRFLMIAGTLVCLAGFGVLLIGIFTFFQNTAAMFGQGAQAGPPTGFGFPPQVFVGFGIFFVGLAITVVGALFRKPKRVSAPPR